MLSQLSLHAGDWSPAPVVQPPAQQPKKLKPIKQRDGHSCGLLALAAIYRAYGIDPKAARLRQRLGTDRPAAKFLKDTEGTLQPDILRVLKQDG
ncbi:MAG: cysteine peptidase family C39 domain-containing protein, partial [Verrucomicrobiota bacterium]